MTSDEQIQEEKSMATVVNDLIANQGVLFVKLHQYHWYVEGPHFFTLHEKFEQLYNETSEVFDLFAERLIAIGEQPYSTLKEYLIHASISEKPYTEKITATEMVQNLVGDYETMKRIALQGVTLAEAENDAVTEDMLVEYISNIDTTIWMLQAFIGDEQE